MRNKIMCAALVSMITLAVTANAIPAGQLGEVQTKEEQALEEQVEEAQEEQVRMQIISCPDQGFSTLCREEYGQTYTPDGGVTIFLGEEDKRPFVSIFKTDAPGNEFDSDYYFANVYLQTLRGTYGDALIDEGETSLYSLSGREMPGRMVRYLDQNDGEICVRFCAYDLRDDCFVRYEAFCEDYDEVLMKTLTAVAVAVGNFQPDANYYSDQAAAAEPETTAATEPAAAAEPEPTAATEPAGNDTAGPGTLFPGFDPGLGE